MLRTFSLLVLFSAGLHSVNAQVTTDTSRVHAVRDSLFQLSEATRLELLQRTSFVLKAPRQGQRRQVVRGYIATGNANPNVVSGRRKLLWKQKRVYLRNGQVKEWYVAQVNGRPLLEERRRNGSVQWLQLTRPQALTTLTSDFSAYYSGTYARSGYMTWRNKKYVFPLSYQTR